jgi:hypothetical protein
MLVAGPGAAANAIHRFEQFEGKTRRLRDLGRRKARRAGADDHDINVFHGYFDPATIIT